MDDSFGSDEIVGWKCKHDHRNEAEAQECACGCGSRMGEGRQIVRDRETGEEYLVAVG